MQPMEPTLPPCPVCGDAVDRLERESVGIYLAQPCGDRVIADYAAGGVNGSVRLIPA